MMMMMILLMLLFLTASSSSSSSKFGSSMMFGVSAFVVVIPSSSQQQWKGKETTMITQTYPRRRRRSQSYHYPDRMKTNRMDLSNTNDDKNEKDDTDDNDNTNTNTNISQLFQRRNNQWIVLVDDEESIRLAVGDFLYDRGYDVTACSDSNSLIQLIIQSQKSKSQQLQQSGDNTNNNNNNDNDNDDDDEDFRLPDVIISDVRMPDSDKNGYELVQLLRSGKEEETVPYEDEDDDSDSFSSTTTAATSTTTTISSLTLKKDLLLPKLKNIPIILLTAKAMTEDRIKGYQCGADVVLPKPFSPEELLSIIDNLIEKKERRTQNHNRRRRALSIMNQNNNNNEEAANTKELKVLKKELDEIKSIMKQNSSKMVEKTDIVLSNKERQLIKLLSDGYTKKEISKELSLRREMASSSSTSTSTSSSSASDSFKSKKKDDDLNRVLEKLYLKTDTISRTELIRWARRVGYIN
jgi:CheY-like chemotaxis protein/DNA-binding CsgD family transcriptional regulator